LRLAPRFVLFGMLLATSCGGASDRAPDDGCQTDLECKGERVCVEGACVEPGAGGAGAQRDAASEPTPLQSEDASMTQRRPDASAPVPAPDASTRAIDAGAPPSFLPGTAVRTGVEASALVADPSRRRVYATVRGDADSHQNELVTIDVDTASVIGAIPIGSNPNTLAISEDGSTLWVGLAGAKAVRRVDLATELPTPAELHSLPLSLGSERATVRQIVVLPGTPRSIALLLEQNGIEPPVVILDDGVPRGARSGPQSTVSSIAGGPEGFLFGYDGLTSGFELFTYELDAEGIRQTAKAGLIQGGSELLYGHGRLYSTGGGEVIDVSKPTRPTLLGTFPIASWPIGGRLLLTSSPERVLCLGIESPKPSGEPTGGLVLQTLDATTFTVTSTVPVGVQKNATDLIARAVHLEPDVFAYSTSAGYDQPGSLYVLKSGSP
jgi:hypothetical protein